MFTVQQSAETPPSLPPQQVKGASEPAGCRTRSSWRGIQPKGLQALLPAKRPPGVVEGEKELLLKSIEKAAKAVESEAARDNAMGRMVSQTVPPQARQVTRRGDRERQSLLNSWGKSEATPPQETTKRKRRRAALEAGWKVQQALEMSGEIGPDPVDLKAAMDKPSASMEEDSDLPEAHQTVKRRLGRPRRAAAEESLARTAAIAAEEFSASARPLARGTPAGSMSIWSDTTPSDLTKLPPEALEMMNSMFRDSGDRRWACRRILQSGILANQAVEYRKPDGQVLAKGIMTASGQVRCFCNKCKGTQEISCLLFEEHAGGLVRKPSDFIVLSSCGMTIRDFCNQGDIQPTELSQRLSARHLDTREPPTLPGSATPLRRPDSASRPVRESSLKASAARDVDTRTPARGLKASSSSGRVSMMAPKDPSTARSASRNHNKNKRLFIAGSGSELCDGEKVSYMGPGQQPILTGTLVINAADISGIRCHHCNEIVSPSQFEAHAGKGARRAPYDFIVRENGETLRQVAARMPDNVDYSALNISYIAHGARRRQLSAMRGRSTGRAGVTADDQEEAEGEVLGGCCICNMTDFTLDKFDDRTIIICDQCELEHHVGCLREHGRCDLKALPEGDWLCSKGCRTVHAVLAAQVEKGPISIPSDGLPMTWQILRSNKEQSGPGELKVVQEILQQSFDPIMELTTNTDLLPVMVASGTFREWDYSGMHCLLLMMDGVPVVAGIFRVFGQRMAELPLIATHKEYRRQGLARKLLDAFVSVLSEAGVGRLCLPAARETVSTWQEGFGFIPMEPKDMEWAASELRMLRFPGTEGLQLEVIPGALGSNLCPEGWARDRLAAKVAAEEGEFARAKEAPAGAEAPAQVQNGKKPAAGVPSSALEEAQPMAREHQPDVQGDKQGAQAPAVPAAETEPLVTTP
mmetsp:Transcript_13830/g.39159  ORF Transcript_13830/g.39159 Transcript_13830/m.39159 type:complete len:924 (+) Transcript_13830:273-3044(+)